MAALSAVLLATLEHGDRVIASNRLYGRTTQLLGAELARFGVRADFVDCADLDAVHAALAEPAKILLAETMSNPLLRLVDVAALAELTEQRRCLLLVDNTFATPVLTRPLELGAGVAMESLTKMIGGHSDVTLGLICGRGELPAQVSAAVSIW